MTIEFEKFQPGKILPSKILDFVMRDPVHGIKSQEFQAAIKKGDLANILEGIDSIILNAEMRMQTKLDDTDRFRVKMMAQDAIVSEIIDNAEKNGSPDKKEKLKKLSEHISRTNDYINKAFHHAIAEGQHG